MSEQTQGRHEMTQFGVQLSVSMDNRELETIGSPRDWNWENLLDQMIGGSEFTTVELKDVVVENHFTVNEDGEDIQETTFSFEKRKLSILEESFKTVLDSAQDHIADNYSKYGGSNQELVDDLSKVAHVRDFASRHFGNREFIDSSLDDSILKVAEKIGTNVCSINTDESDMRRVG